MNKRTIFPRPLQYLISITEYGSYTRAAEALHVSQPTMSQQIKQLEGALNVTLLKRAGRGVQLTDAGKVYVQHAKRALNEIDAGTRALHDVHDLSRGSLRLGWTPITDYLACSLLESYNRQFPGITLSTLEMPADDIEAAVAEDRIDIGIAFSKTLPSEISLPEITTDVLFEESLCLAVGRNHQRAGQENRLSASEFGKESLILLNSEFALRRHVDQYCASNGIKPRIAIETDSLSAIIEITRTGPLATVLPKGIIQTQCGLHPIVMAPILPSKTITMITRTDGYQSPACLAFKRLGLLWAEHRLNEMPLRKQIQCPLSASFGKDRPGTGQNALS